MVKKYCLATLVGLIPMISGCDVKIDISVKIVDGSLRINISAQKNSLRGPLTDQMIGALAIPNDVVVKEPQFTINGTAEDVDQNVSVAHQEVLQAALEAAGFFDSATQRLEFFQTTNPITTDGTANIQFSFAGNPCFNQLAVAGSTASILDACDPQNVEMCDIPTRHEEKAIECIPAVSALSLSVMAFLVLTAGAVVIARRRRALAT